MGQSRLKVTPHTPTAAEAHPLIGTSQLPHHSSPIPVFLLGRDRPDRDDFFALMFLGRCKHEMGEVRSEEQIL